MGDPDVSPVLTDEGFDLSAALIHNRVADVIDEARHAIDLFVVVIEVAGDDDRASLIQIDKKRLVSGGMAGRKFDDDLAVAEDVVIPVLDHDLLAVA